MNNARFLLALGAATALACGHAKDQQVENKPTASFKFTQSSVRPQVFSFDASASSVTVGSIAKYTWTFGDEASGAPATDVTAASTQHAYKAAGTYTVTLVVTDDKDLASDPVTKMVTVDTVNTAGPSAKLTGPTTGMSGTPLTFDGSTSTPSGDLQNYAWDFGDSSAVTMGKDKTLVQHTFATDGQYTVTLTVTDSLGSSDSAELHVAIGDVGPLAVCTFLPQAPVQGAPVMFDASQSVVPMGSSPIYVWDFGDGVMNVPGKMVSHTYSGAGPYTPKLTVTVQGKPPNTADCPTVMPGAAPLCVGDYQWHATMDPGCGWSGTTVTVTQNANGTITLSEPFSGGTMVMYTGMWTGNTFSVSGSYMDMGFQYDITITGTFSGCGSWTGAYDTNVEGIVDCVTQVAATQL